MYLTKQFEVMLTWPGCIVMFHSSRGRPSKWPITFHLPKVVCSAGNRPWTAWCSISPRSARVGARLIWRVGWIKLRLSQEDHFKGNGIWGDNYTFPSNRWCRQRDVTLMVRGFKEMWLWFFAQLLFVKIVKKMSDQGSCLKKITTWQIFFKALVFCLFVC